MSESEMMERIEEIYYLLDDEELSVEEEEDLYSEAEELAEEVGINLAWS